MCRKSFRSTETVEKFDNFIRKITCESDRKRNRNLWNDFLQTPALQSLINIYVLSLILLCFQLTEQLSRTPAQSRANEWLASYHCARDILHVFPQIADLKDDRIEPLVDELRQCKGVLEDCFEIFSLFENPLKLLEQPEQQIQNVAGVMFELYAQLDRIYIKAVDPKQPKEVIYYRDEEKCAPPPNIRSP